MPDAIITSTASTFGTISGTFAADQSTVTGTVTGIITGTLSGSVGVPGATGPAGQGVPAGGTAGQYLQKIDGTNYNTDWVTVNLGAYAVKANNLSDLTNFATARDNLGLGLLYTPTFAGVTVQGAGANVANLTPTSLTLNHTGYGYFTIQPSQGIRFPDASVQTTAFPAGSDVPTGGTTGQALVKVSNSNYDVDWATVASYITSVSSPLSVTSGNLSVDLSTYLTSATAASTYQTLAGMSSYLTTATAASTYAVIAAGQPTAGTTGQVLTKNSGTNYDSSWTTIIPGDRYLTSSTTSNTVSNGTKSFTIGTGLSYTPTQNITISYDASNHMHGEVLTYNSGTGALSVDVNYHTGSGTYTAWVINVGGVTPATSVAWGAITGTLSAQTDLQSALDAKLAVTTAASTYQTLSGMSSYLTTSAAASTYLTQSNAASTYQTLAGMSSYLTTSTAASTYFTIASAAGKANLSGATFTNDILVSSSPDTTTVGAGILGMTSTSNSYFLTLSTIAGYPQIFFRGPTGDSVQTVAYPGPTGFLLKADNLSGLANTGTARTNLGLGTMAVETASNYLTTATAASTYQPISGMSSYLTTASAASTYFTIASAANKADLASPALTGTPTAPTAAAATNTTQIATTAFVQQEVPAASTTAAGKVELATNAESITSNSSSLVPALLNIPAIITRPENRSLNYINSTAISGSGAASTNNSGVREIYLNSLATGRAAYWLGVPTFNQTACLMSRANNQLIDFSKKIWLSGKTCAGFNIATNYIGDANTMCRITLGGYNNNATGDMTGKGFGWKKVGGTSPFFTLTVHNGTSLTDVATTIQQSDKKVIDWVIYSDGTGNVTLYIDGAQAATTSAGPTGLSTAGWSMYREQVEATATPGVRGIMHCTGGNLYIEG